MLGGVRFRVRLDVRCWVLGVTDWVRVRVRDKDRVGKRIG